MAPRSKATTVKALQPLGNMTSVESEHIIALDGIAAIVNPGNPVQSLTIPQLKALFSGEIQDWSQVPNGKKAPVVVLARNAKSGTFDTFQRLVLRDAKLSSAATTKDESGDLVAAVAADPNAIGFVGLPNLKPSVKVLAVAQQGGRPLFPNALTIRTEDYALARRLFFYVPQKPASPLTRELVDFAESPEGQQIVEKTGAVGMFIEEEVSSDAKCEDCTEEYQRATQGAHRLDLNLRFERKSDVLDTLAQSNVKRLVATMQRTNESRKLVLLGFTDSVGAAQANQELSEKRAESVSSVLQQNGLVVGAAEGFGAQMPIGDNDDDEGRHKNRRVEVWIR